MTASKTTGFKYSCINLKNVKEQVNHVKDTNCCKTQNLTKEQIDSLNVAKYELEVDTLTCTFDSEKTAILAREIFLQDTYNLTQALGKTNGVSVDASKISSGKLVIKPLSAETNFIAKQITGFTIKNKRLYCSSDLKKLIGSIGSEKFLSEIGLCCALDKGLLTSSKPIFVDDKKSKNRK